MSIVPILFCVDCEPDQRQPDPTRPVDWAGWDLAQSALSEWRGRLVAATGRPVHFGWYLRIDPQIEKLHGDAAYLATRDRAFFAACAAAGDDIGAHSHAHRWDATSQDWIIDHADAAWVDHIVDVGCADYRRAFGRRLRSFRFGDGFISERVTARLARWGVRYDLSLEPGLAAMAGFYAHEKSTGILPDRSAAPRAPHRPAARHFWRRSPWTIPISTAPPPSGTFHGYAYVQMNYAHPPEPTSAMFDWLLAERAAPFAVLAVRAGDMSNPELAANIHANLDALRRHPRVRDFAFLTLPSFVRWYRRFGRTARRGERSSAS